MQLAGTVINGVVVLDQNHRLPEGARVAVVVPEIPADQPTLSERLLRLAGTVDDLPSDMARNHDHYIHGAPKQ